ncbi:Aste57867_18924 [Aphanomyces stellatus]|uniref:Aste57867_18924 protein n=1 Tax=Aphanomyces stellatus TaxID=120398 RepID=A0A485LBN1_9STRA|nr:hypothetical protein As57867_018860 [Aphanomyces stellatus]VFT95656.1 Aste57867_18924 [Aphanomyces stellatus]
MADLLQVHVLSAAGKPIFSTTSDDCSNASFSGLIQGISSFSDDTLRQITTSSHVLTFLPSPPLLYFCAASKSLAGLNVPRLLHLLKSHLLVFLTQNGLALMESNPNYDLRNLLYGTHGVLVAVTVAWTECVWAQLDHTGVAFWPMKADTRRALQHAMDIPGLVFGLVSRRGHVVAFRQGHKDHPFLVEDVHVLHHVVAHMPSFKSSESWTPLCLPAFNSTGFLYGYVVFLTPDVHVVLLSTDQAHTQFHAFQERTQDVLRPLLDTAGLLEQPPPGRPASLLPRRFVPLLVHFLYQHERTHEVVTPPFADCAVLDTPQWRTHILRQYCTLHRRLHGPTTHEPRKLGVPRTTEPNYPATIYFIRSETTVALGLVKPTGYLYVCCQPLLTADHATDLAEALYQVICNDMLTAA